MPIAEITGTDLYYEERGQGPVCLAMHGGLGMDHQYLLKTLTPLERRMRMVYYDHRCNGRSGRPAIETLTIEQLADDADRLAEHLGADQAVVFGHSYGGFVAQELALRHPGRVRALILADTTPGQLGMTESPDDEQGEPPPAELMEAWSAQPATDVEFAASMDRLMAFYLHRADPTVVAAVTEGTIFSVEANVRSMSVLGEWSSVDRLGQVAVPVVLLVGKYDYATSPPQSYRIANRVGDAEVHVFGESGHFPWIEEQEAFFGALGSWLDRQGIQERR